jgi:uncharacterized protein (DUF952 family)
MNSGERLAMREVRCHLLGFLQSQYHTQLNLVATISHAHTQHEASVMSAEQRDPESSTVLYKILAPEEAESLPSRSWTGTALDLQDGFLHLSTSDQLAGTLGRFFSKDAFAGDVLFLLRLPRAAIRTDQKLQFDLAHGIKFGHVYSVCRDRPSRRVPL